jgi:hypothetical protein
LWPTPPEIFIGARGFPDLVQRGHHRLQFEANGFADIDSGGDDSVTIPIQDRPGANVEDGCQILGFKKLLHVTVGVGLVER